MLQIEKFRMSELTKAKLQLIIAVMIEFTIIGVVSTQPLTYYILSLVVFPLITWCAIEFSIYMNKKQK